MAAFGEVLKLKPLDGGCFVGLANDAVCFDGDPNENGTDDGAVDEAAGRPNLTLTCVADD